MEYKKGERVKHPTKEDWGLGEVISDRNEEFVTVLFVGAGEKKLALKYVQPLKVTADESANQNLDELKKEVSNQYRIGKTPRSTASHNIKTWQRLEVELARAGSATFEQLVFWCKDHEHPAGGLGFVNYCIDNGWLVSKERISNSGIHKQQTTKNNKYIHNGGSDSGIYIAFLLTEKFMPVTRDPRYVDTCAKVNNQNVKIGKTINLKRRKQDYWKDFDAHNVEFIPIALLDDIDRAEDAIKKRLDRYRLISPKGGKMDWLTGIDPMSVVQASYDALESGAFKYQAVKNKFI